MKHTIISPVVDVYGIPDKEALRGKFETQLVFGEGFIVNEENDGWCQGTCLHDGYPGYIQSHHLAKNVPAATHTVITGRSVLYREATIKSAAVGTLSFGSKIAMTQENENWAQMTTGAWIYRKHIAPIDVPFPDYLAAARKFLETPYYWGGRSGFGIDCSGLVQICLSSAGLNVPRDTEIQQDTIGVAADSTKAGDIIFFPGHVGFMADSLNLLHANAFHMKVVIEPLRAVIDRGQGITSIRRLYPAAC